eukprot:TRINITY_DN222_c0_g1_i1.p1 TRINITY_DN222_c0_g1~~TRINITY_DN222_c0_g1_i1.p1  ORF type:complete len:295 (-),score=41.31 TRINITY_DN222_c0_g1_i1:445-1329(-)
MHDCFVYCFLFILIILIFFFFLMIRRPPRSTHCISSAASDVYKRQGINAEYMGKYINKLNKNIFSHRVMNYKQVLLILAVFVSIIFLFWKSNSVTFPVMGITVTQAVTDYKCLEKNYITFVAIQGQQYQQYNLNAVQIINTTYFYGLDADLIIQPCQVSSDPVEQANYISTVFDRHKIKKTWIKVNSASQDQCVWIDPDTNCQFLFNLMERLEVLGFSTGIFSSAAEWKNVFGTTTTCTRFSNKPLWYVNNDGIANFTDFTAFGGWTIPLEKQYNQNQTICSQQVDLDYHTYYP